MGNGEGSVFVDDDSRIRFESGGTTLYPICEVIDFDGERDANARLIAAAPDLLEACEKALRSIKAAQPEFFTDQVAVPLITAMGSLQEAITKATGESE